MTPETKHNKLESRKPQHYFTGIAKDNREWSIHLGT